MARTPINVPLSARTYWFLDALIESGRYAETRQEIIRTFVLEGIGRAQDAGHIERPTRDLEGIPPAEEGER